MRLSFKFKHHFFSAFREFFVHHHGSLEFRAKIFALLIISNDEIDQDSYSIVKNIGMNIYNDEDRANVLMLSTKELVKKIQDHNGLDIDTLVLHIQKELKIVPRYAKKIDIESLQPFLELTRDRDIISYQENILEFLKTLKEETLHDKKSQIAKDEENLESKY
ncbi:hypothetical protein [Sulfurimonas sp.]|uniref:hypothetical protein n=1 Tax=Sulfurimonas sp. TaxID=2022749 RepID=UPI0025F9DB14|nr:hypothetical protein [Sulfurimonas sp.]